MDPEREEFEPEPEPVEPELVEAPEPQKRGRPKKEPAEPKEPKPRGRPKKPAEPQEPPRPKKEPANRPVERREEPLERVYEDPMEHLAMLLHQHTEDAKARRREQMRNLLGF